jgi:hypothetical protein
VAHYTRGGESTQEFQINLFDPNGKQLWFIPKKTPSADVAITWINFDALMAAGIKCSFFPSDWAADREAMRTNGISEGDGVFVLGFPMGLVDKEQNFVIVRQGIIAKIRDALNGASDQYLIDASVFPGNSGSPVVLKPEATALKNTSAHNQTLLIGIVSGYIPYREVVVSQQTGQTRVVFEENSGLASVMLIDHVKDAVKEQMAVVTQTSTAPSSINT